MYDCIKKFKNNLVKEILSNLVTKNDLTPSQVQVILDHFRESGGITNQYATVAEVEAVLASSFEADLVIFDL